MQGTIPVDSFMDALQRGINLSEKLTQATKERLQLARLLRGHAVVERVIDNPFDFSTKGEWSPKINVVEKSDRFLIKAELPGVNENDVEVSITGNVLTIAGDKQEDSETERQGFYYSESSYGNFVRTFTVPSSIETDDIEANFNDGVLEISMPKSKD